MLLNKDSASDMRERSTALKYCGMAIAARMPKMSTTTNNSIRVKPFLLFIKPPTVLFISLCSSLGYLISILTKKQKIKLSDLFFCPAVMLHQVVGGAVERPGFLSFHRSCLLGGEKLVIF